MLFFYPGLEWSSTATAGKILLLQGGTVLKNIAITGAAGYLGQKLLKQLEQHSSVEKIVAVDIRKLHDEMLSEKTDFHLFDIRAPELEPLFKAEKVDCVIHLAFVVAPIRNKDEMHSINREGMANVLRATAACGARQLIVASSTSAFGAFPDNPAWLDENASLREHNGYAYAEDKFAVEKDLQGFSENNAHVKIAVVRPCIIYGPGVDNYLSRFLLNWPFLIQIGAARPEMQFIHEDDVVRALVLVFEQEAVGYFHIVGEGLISTKKIAELAGIKILPLPPWIAYPLINLLYLLRFPGIEAPAVMLDFIRYRWTASDLLTRERLKFSPRYSSEEVISELIKTKRT